MFGSPGRFESHEMILTNRRLLDDLQYIQAKDGMVTLHFYTVGKF